MLGYDLRTPLSVQVELTTRCNNRCSHCYNFQKQVEVPEMSMSTTDLRTVLARLEEAQVFAVGFTGGEPFLLPSLVRQGVGFCNDRGIRCSVNSNLTPINPAAIE
jgi:MoaA/NifB/PqqE/SkfB family radical SAM enzyme